MLLTSTTICCFVLSVQSQFTFDNQFFKNIQARIAYNSQLFNTDRLLFPDNRPQVVPLTVPSETDQDVVRSIFQNPLPQQTTSPSVEIEKINEVAFGSIVDQVPKANSEAVVGRQVSSPIPNNPSIVEALQFVTESQHEAETTVPPQKLSFKNLVYTVTNFGINLLKNINSVQPGNAVVSPYSITSLLALLQQGALGQTRDQITNALQMAPEISASSFAQVSGEFKNRNSRNILETANNLFIADAFTINPDFKKIAQRSFNSDITPLHFARPDLAASEINKWVSIKTNKKIEKLVAPDALDVATQIVLANAVYFKGLWEVPFRVEATIGREFRLSNGQTKTAQYMRMRKMFKTGMDPYTNAKVVILPFELDQYSLMVILPSDIVGVSNTLSTLTDAQLLSYLNFPGLETELEIPKFTVRAETDLTPIFRNMGITNMFSQQAELSGLGTFRNYSPQISSAVHSAVLSIDEKGGSAAAATAFAAVALSYDEPDVVFKANRPFIAILWDVKNSIPLFVAKIEDPQP